MITKVIDLLQSESHYGVSIEVEIAKGKFELKTFKKRIENIKRYYYLFKKFIKNYKIK